MLDEVLIQNQANLELVGRLYRAFGDRDLPTVLALLAEDVDWLFFGPPSIPFAGHYRGRAEVENFFRIALGSMDFLEFEPEEFSATPHHVLVQGREKGRAKATGRVWEIHWAHVFSIENDRIVKMREYYDTASVAAAFSAAALED